MRLIIITCLLAILFSTVAFAAPFTGSLSIQAPALTPDRLQDDSPQLCLDVRLPDCIGPITLWGKVEHSLKNGMPYEKENKLRLGGDLPLYGNLSLYSYWERRYSTNHNRVVVGCKLNFKGCY